MSTEDPQDALLAAPSREVFLTALATALQRVLSEPTLARDVLVEGLKAAGRRVDQPVVVAVGGMAGVGKSSVLNAILASGLLPEGPLPSPGCRVVVRHGDAWSVEVRYAGGARQAIDVEWWHGAVVQGSLDALTGAERLEIAVPYELLKSMVLIDTPGLYADDDRDSRATEDALAGAEALVWVTAAADPLPAMEAEALAQFGRQLAGRAVCVLTRTDALDDPMEDIPAAKHHVGEALPGFFSAVAAIDVRAGVPEAATPVLSAIKKGILDKREAIKVYAAREAARTAFVRRRATLAADGLLTEPPGVVTLDHEKLSLTHRKLDALVGDHLGTVAKAWETAERALQSTREEVSAMLAVRPGVEEVEARLRVGAARPLTALSEEISESITRTMTEYARMVRLAVEDSEPLAVDLLLGQTELFTLYAEHHWRRLNAFYWGGMKTGGAKGLCAAPRTSNSDERVDAWLPMARLIELGTKYVTEYREAVDERHARWKKLAARVLGTAEPDETLTPMGEAMAFVAECLGA